MLYNQANAEYKCVVKDQYDATMYDENDTRYIEDIEDNNYNLLSEATYVYST